MPVKQRFKTKYPGVYYILGVSNEKIFYIRYRKKGKSIDEKAGRQYQDDMTPARASNLRSKRIEGAPSNVEQREQERKKAKAYTIEKLWQEYKFNRTLGASLKIDHGRYENYIKPIFGNKEPKDIIKLDVDRVRIKLLKKLAPQTVKHILNLLTWIINYGVNNNLCAGISFHIKKPTVYNEKTEDLTPEQLENLLKAIEEDGSDVGKMMKLALYSGMRRGEMLNLKWDDIKDGFIFIRSPKGGIDQKIPMNDMVINLLNNISHTSEYVFPGRYGDKRTTTGVLSRRIREKAELPENFRPMHGLRHVYASMLASSGKVDMYVLQRLLTHKSPKMTQRYAHLRDETLKNGAKQIDDIFAKTVSN
ncbi:MAG: site-specific integrase [Bacteroidetes bacterium]|nr:site-specific integrase [Bacteroidota bacterium]